MKTATRGTSNGNARGSTSDRRRRREYLVATYRADVDLVHVHDLDWDRHTLVDSDWDDTTPKGHLPVEVGQGIPACRCYRCGTLLHVDTVTVDRIIPGCRGGTYRRDNIRPACGPCNSSTGARLRRATS